MKDKIEKSKPKKRTRILRKEAKRIEELYSVKSEINESMRALRKKIKRIESSRSLFKTKNREKGKLIKFYRGRQTELVRNRDLWKGKFKQKEIDCKKLSDKYKDLKALLKTKEKEPKETAKLAKQKKSVLRQEMKGTSSVSPAP